MLILNSLSIYICREELETSGRHVAKRGYFTWMQQQKREKRVNLCGWWLPKLYRVWMLDSVAGFLHCLSVIPKLRNTFTPTSTSAPSIRTQPNQTKPNPTPPSPSLYLFRCCRVFPLIFTIPPNIVNVIVIKPWNFIPPPISSLGLRS